MKLSVFVSALGWTSVFCMTWLWLLGAVKMDGLHIGLYVLFWFLAIIAGTMSMERRIEKPRH